MNSQLIRHYLNKIQTGQVFDLVHHGTLSVEEFTSCFSTLLKAGYIEARVFYVEERGQRKLAKVCPEKLTPKGLALLNQPSSSVA
ncbi:MAG: hypothetical protein AAGG02_05230 [Cyanobacteria bacterium P01_H01_bin.15]